MVQIEFVIAKRQHQRGMVNLLKLTLIFRICSSCDIKWPSNRVLEGRVRAIVEAVEKAQVFSQKAPTKVIFI